MRIDCLHGYFIFKEDHGGEASYFTNYYGLPLVGKDHYFTFPSLKDAPEYSIKGAPLLGQTATETFQGKPWEVMEKNGLVFDLTTGTVKPVSSIKTQVEISQAGFYFYSNGLINPGSLRTDGKKVKSYRAKIIQRTWSYRYSEVTYF